MNATESAAYRWLLATEGYTPETLTFQRRSSPSFRGADGRAWEPKLARNATVLFTAAQIDTIRAHGKCSVLIWTMDGKAPEAIMPARALGKASVPGASVPGYWRQYRLLVTGNGAKKESAK